MRYPVLLAAGLVSFFSACYSVPARVDPFAQTQRPDLPSRRLSVVLVDTENARNARKYLYGMPYSASLTDPFFENLTAVFRRNFKTVTKADTLEEAKASGADVVAMLDVYAHLFYGFMNSGNHLDLGAILLAADGTEIDHLKTSHDTNGFAHVNPSAPMQELADKNLAAFEELLRDSPKLQAFAPARASRPEVAAAPAPSVPVLHSEVDAPSYKLRENSDDFALVAGVEKYESLPQADFAERDAAAVREHLLALGYPERNIIFLTGSKASKAGIEKYLESWLPRNVTARSRVFVYFSGHGAPDVRSGQAYLVPWDGDAKFLSDTAYPVKRLYEKLNALPAKEIVVALDSCFSGSGGRSVLAQGMRPLVTRIDTGSASVGRLVVFSASGADEATGTLADQGHGLFTYEFLKGLEQGKDGLTAKGLFDFLKPRVQDAARRDNRDQTPQLITGEKSGAGLRLR